ncbi:PilZ domain-containing protein [Novosphingobium sp.]|uniref:PilZ domain-containing protein n=1 Tax=Novosphingobium sp. TaxID=1874826 RepID=UPI0026176893|nr:PilZ domain-containing protein [Novosphingobium sp.]
MALYFNPFGRRPVFSRADVRHACRIDGEIVLTEKMVSYEGRLINLSRGGAMFRPRLAYLMNRRGDAVLVQAAGLALVGEIVATTPQGFGVRFEQPLGDGELAHLLAHNAAASATP